MLPILKLKDRESGPLNQAKELVTQRYLQFFAKTLQTSTRRSLEERVQGLFAQFQTMRQRRKSAKRVTSTRLAPTPATRHQLWVETKKSFVQKRSDQERIFCRKRLVHLASEPPKKRTWEWPPYQNACLTCGTIIATNCSACTTEARLSKIKTLPWNRTMTCCFWIALTDL